MAMSKTKLLGVGGVTLPVLTLPVNNGHFE